MFIIQIINTILYKLDEILNIFICFFIGCLLGLLIVFFEILILLFLTCNINFMKYTLIKMDLLLLKLFRSILTEVLNDVFLFKTTID